MSVSDWFKTFNTNIRISSSNIDKIRYRTQQITRRINLDYHGLDDKFRNSIYVGSYGRDTDIVTSDIDLVVRLPVSEYHKYDGYTSNGQSALLQSVRNSLQKTYSTSHLRGDGQVVIIRFDDGIIFEIVPAFNHSDGQSFVYPDSNNGGSWKTTKPRQEINAIKDRNILVNKNLKRLCRMARSWKYRMNVNIGGLLIDTFAYNFIADYEYKDKSYLYYDYMSRDFFAYIYSRSRTQTYWTAPGSGQYVYKKGPFHNQAKRAYDLAVEAIEKEKDYPITAKIKWRDIYGTKFPS